MAERGAQPKVPALQRRALRAVRALSSPLLPDDYLELINPLWSTRELRGRIERIEHETPDAATVLIKPGYQWEGHKPGQYLSIGLDLQGVRHCGAYHPTTQCEAHNPAQFLPIHLDIELVRHWRTFSLTSKPERPDGCISITVKNVD